MQWLTRERDSCSLLRPRNMGRGIDTENISAHYSTCVLGVTIPMVEKVKSRKIEVTTNRDSDVVEKGSDAGNNQQAVES